MADSEIHFISLCSGVGGLDLGVRLALPGSRVVGYVEREAYAAAVLLARMEDKALDAAPIWCGDIREFDGGPWRGAVDGIVAGIPCQPHSVAGKRLGAADERDLWPEAARLIGEIEPEFVFLENVGGATRFFLEHVGGELERTGWRVAAGLFSAAEVGASHRRERLFLLADRSGEGIGRARMRKKETRNRRCDVGRDCEELALSSQRGLGVRGEPSGGDETLADCPGERCQRHTEPNGGALESEQSASRWADAWRCDEAMGDAEQSRADAGAAGSRSWHPVGESGGQVADAEHAGSRAGIEGQQSKAAGQWRNRSSNDGIPLFPPGPADLEAWRRVLEVDPTLEPAICGVADGLAQILDGDRMNENADDQETSAAIRFARWKMLHQMRLYEIIAAASSGLLQTDRSGDRLSGLPYGDRDEGGKMGRKSNPLGNLQNLRNAIYAETESKIDDLWKSGLPTGVRSKERNKAMANRVDRLRACGNGVVPLQAAWAFVSLAAVLYGR